MKNVFNLRCATAAPPLKLKAARGKAMATRGKAMATRGIASADKKCIMKNKVVGI